MRQEGMTRRRFIRSAAIVGTGLALPRRVWAATSTVLTSVLGRPTGSTIALSVLSSASTTAYIEYGVVSGKYTAKTAITKLTANVPSTLELKGLKPNARTYYRLRTGSAAAGAEASFMTQRAPGTDFTFTVQGDSHPERAGQMFNSELYMRTMSNIASHKPDFHILLGDDFSIDPLLDKGQGTASNINAVYAQQRQYLNVIGSSTAVFLVNGNHEQAAAYLLDGTATSPAVLAGKSRLQYYALPANGDTYSVDIENVPQLGSPRDYYAWTWGDATFITLDPYWHSKYAVDNVATSAADAATGKATKKGTTKTADLWEVGLGDVQYSWFKKQLESSTSKYIFVFAHHVMGTGRGGVEQSYFYEWGGKDPKGKATFAQKRATWEAPIHDLMVKHGVAVFFQGHDHIFVHQERDGVVYQSMPNPADNTFTMFNADAYTSGTKAPNSGHVRVHVTDTKATVEYFLAARPQDEGTDRKNLQLAHSYAVLPRGAVATSTGALTVAIQADPHMDENSDAAVYSATLAQISAIKPAFMLDLGDIFMIDKLSAKTDANMRARYTLMKGFYEQLDPSIPLHLAMGNHDGETPWDKLPAHALRAEYFPAQTSALNYYAIEQGNALFLVLDPFSFTTTKPGKDGWKWTLGKTQYEWLRSTLASTTAVNRYVCIHQLVGGDDQGRGGIEFANLYEWGGHGASGQDEFAAQRPGWEMPIHQLLVKHGVQIVFKGHDHLYAKQMLDGVVYQTLPQPSHPGDKLGPTSEYGYINGEFIGGSGFLKLAIEDATTTVQFIHHTGNVLSTYTTQATQHTTST